MSRIGIFKVTGTDDDGCVWGEAVWNERVNMKLHKRAGETAPECAAGDRVAAQLCVVVRGSRFREWCLLSKDDQAKWRVA